MLAMISKNMLGARNELVRTRKRTYLIFFFLFFYSFSTSFFLYLLRPDVGPQNVLKKLILVLYQKYQFDYTKLQVILHIYHNIAIYRLLVVSLTFVKQARGPENHPGTSSTSLVASKFNVWAQHRT